MKILLYISIIFLSKSLSAQNTDSSKKAKSYKIADTIQMLTNNKLKYWDKITTGYFSSCDYDSIGWRFSSNHKLYEYYYDSTYRHKRFECIYGRDVVLGDISFKIVGDTLVLPEYCDKYLIKRITNDTLIVNHLAEKGNKMGYDDVGDIAVFVKSKNQKKMPIPVFHTN